MFCYTKNKHQITQKSTKQRRNPSTSQRIKKSTNPSKRSSHQVSLALLFSCALLLMALAGCEKDTTKHTSSDQKIRHSAHAPDKANNISITLWATGSSHIQQSILAAEKLKLTIAQLLQAPSEDTLQAAREQWLKAYYATQALMPLLYLHDDHSSIIKALNNWRFTLISWPIQPGYIDSYKDHKLGGIVHDFTLSINSPTIRRQHGIIGQEEAVLGLHAIEFMLWGDKGDKSINSLHIDTQLPPSYRTAKLTLVDLPNNRRRQLLSIQSQLLLSDLQTLANQWQSNHLLSLAYFQLTPSQRLNAMNSSIKGYLQIWSERLKGETSESKSYVSIDDFSQQHLIGLQHGINSIINIYFQGQPAFASQLFSHATRVDMRAQLENVASQIAQASTDKAKEEATDDKIISALQKKQSLLKKINTLITTLTDR